MTARRSLATLAAAVLVLVLGAVALYAVRGQPTTAVIAPIPTATATPTASSSPVPTPTPQPGSITGRFAYGSDFIPPVTVYAIGADDQRVWFSVEFPGYGNPPRPTAQPGSEPGTYTLSGVAPGTYWVVAYRNDGQKPDPGVYTRQAECMRRTPSGPCPDQTPVLVTVTAGQTTREIDIVSWWPGSGLMPPPPPRPVRISAAPEGVVLPQVCRLVSGPTPVSNTTEWRFSCVETADSIRLVAASLEQQGWARCLPQPGIAEWWKGSIMTRLTPAANASDNPVLMQAPRFLTNCP